MRPATSGSRWPSSPVCTASDVARASSFAQRTLLVCSLAVLAGVVAPVAAVSAAEPWWVPVGLRGIPVDAVSAGGKTVLVRTGSGTTMLSDNGGLSFAPVAGNPPIQAPAVVKSGADRWAIDASGRVLHAIGSGALTVDPGAPQLGASAHLIAAPAAFPGIVVAVAVDGVVWRRGQDGGWQRALLLLPAGFPKGVPRVTGVAAFTQPLSGTVYLGTDGYSVLSSTNGGDDWIRAGPGLPGSVLALTTDAATHAVYAGTSDGLWVHHLRALPAPPAYHDAALVWRWVGIGLVSLAFALAGAALLLVALPRIRPA
jgi:hypothetical protein